MTRFKMAYCDTADPRLGTRSGVACRRDPPTAGSFVKALRSFGSLALPADERKLIPTVTPLALRDVRCQVKVSRFIHVFSNYSDQK
jgi:hypothetical protein